MTVGAHDSVHEIREARRQLWRASELSRQRIAAKSKCSISSVDDYLRGAVFDNSPIQLRIERVLRGAAERKPAAA
jgi:hypothetical protein